jgi:hypothetical protein
MDTISKSISSFQKTVSKRTSRYEDVLQDRNVDAVIIATPHHWHCPMTLRAIEPEMFFCSILRKNGFGTIRVPING